ncbi:MAG: hypothetical protein CMI18_10085 [Opitutaceae bacterium]|nr:hypothetical protein [Opitutaceae bacterium]
MGSPENQTTGKIAKKVIRLSTQHFSEWTGGKWSQDPPAEITEFNIDSRKVEDRQVFVAIRTGRRDGHDFVKNAKSRGAVAALVTREDPKLEFPQLVVPNVEKALHDMALKVRIKFTGTLVAITGSCGKTSTKEFLSSLLGDGNLKTRGNLNNHLGVPLTLLRLNKEYENAVVEIGMNAPGEIAGLARISQPDYSIITTVAPVHLQGVGSLEGVALEKAALAAATQVLTVLPSTCFRFAPFSDLKAPCLVAGKPEPGRYYPVSCRFVDFSLDHSKNQTDIVIRPSKGRVMSFSTGRTSNGMARNMVLCLLLCLERGMDPNDLQARLNIWKPEDLRCERIQLGGLDIFLDCYNANPSSMRDSLEYFQATTPEDRPRFYVIGGMKELGEYTEGYHEELGRSFKLRSIDRLYLTGREVNGFIRGFRTAGKDEDLLKVFDDDREVVTELKDQAGSVFLKGSRAYALENIYLQLKSLNQQIEATC